jgi:enamine deaminase RidA (YjgF/YER057c/UK114 family)
MTSTSRTSKSLNWNRSFYLVDIEHIKPVIGKSFPEQVQSCIEQLSDIIFPVREARYFITQQIFFINATSRNEYDERAALIREQLSAACGASLPATSIVAQSPACGNDVALELICASAKGDINVHYKSLSGLSYTVVEQDGFKTVHVEGLTGAPGDSILESSQKAFDLSIKILEEEGLSIDHIIRQWNYIEDIAQFEGVEHERQNYQVFNDVRSRYYDKGVFENGYPAATGIGMDTGGVIIGFIALSPSDQVLVRPIQNPGQIDAHRYSKNVLKGTLAEVPGLKSSPKFERAKLVTIGSNPYIFVSGTASILGEKTMHVGDVGKQTLTTIENIFKLFSKENQESLGLEFDVLKIRFSHLRVYVKFKKDIPLVKEICQSRLNSNSSLFLISDICRKDLLVEIEGVFTL